jgi:hypothetical protein
MMPPSRSVRDRRQEEPAGAACSRELFHVLQNAGTARAAALEFQRRDVCGKSTRLEGEKLAAASRSCEGGVTRR